MAIFLFLAIAVVFDVWGYYLYIKHSLTQATKPNPATWILWLFMAVMLVVTYWKVTRSMVAVIVPIENVLTVVVVVYICLKRSKMRALVLWEKFITACAALTFCTFLLTEGDHLPYFLLQFSVFLSFWPMFKAARDGEEAPGPWVIWTVAYTSFTLNAYLKGVPWQEQFYPFHYTILHGVMWFLSQNAKQRRLAVVADPI